MDRKTKNIMMGIILAGSIGLTGYTGYLASNSLNSNNPQSMQMPSQPQNNQNSQGNSSTENSNNQNSNNNSGQTSDNQNSSDNNQNSTDGQTSQDNSQSQSNNNGTPPSMPGNGNSNGTPPSMNGNGNQPSMPGNSQGGSNATVSNINGVYYVLLGAESLVISSTVIYLILSKGNKKSLKETLPNVDKKIIAALSVILLTGGLTFGETMVIKNIGSTNTITENSSSSNVTYSAAKTIDSDETITSGTYSSSTKNENAILSTGENTVSLSNITVNKTGDSNDGDSTSFYGQNSAILAKSGSNLTIKNATITTNATGANGVFSYGGSATTNNTSSDNTTVTISDSTITTKKDNSGGIMTTGGGKMVATNLTVNTSGTSSAAIRTDRGGGDVTVNKGTYTTTGKGSPAIYSTANVKVSNATLVSKASEGVVIEGNNSVTLNKVSLTDTNSTLNGQSTTYKNIFLYQSQSGDAADGNSTFTSKDSTITTNKGDSFYITNTTAIINLTNNTIVNNDSSGYFLRAQADSRGQSGSNGGNVTLNMTNQSVNGNIAIDNVSTLTMNLTSSSYYEGAINTDNKAKSITLKLDASSKIKLTGDTYVTSLENADTSNSNIDFNGYKLYVNGTAINA